MIKCLQIIVIIFVTKELTINKYRDIDIVDTYVTIFVTLIYINTFRIVKAILSYILCLGI